MPVRTGGPAPYAPAASVLELIHAYRNRGLQTPFTRDVLTRAGVSDSIVPRALQSLRLLDLTDDAGNPTAQMEALRRAPEPEFQVRLADVIKSAYAEVFQYVDPAEDPPERIRDAFRAFEPIGQIGRMVTLFLGLSQAAGLAPEEQKRKSRPRRNIGGKSRPTASSDKLYAKAIRSPAITDESVAVPTDARTMALPPAIEGLMKALPRNGEGWTAEQRNRFLTTFTTVLDFSIPITNEPNIE